MNDKPKLTEEQAKEVSDKVQRLIDPVYKVLSTLSAQLSAIDMGGLEIETRTGFFHWQPKFRNHSDGHTVN